MCLAAFSYTFLALFGVTNLSPLFARIVPDSLPVGAELFPQDRVPTDDGIRQTSSNGVWRKRYLPASFPRLQHQISVGSMLQAEEIKQT
jgi:hypothetical protein